MIKKIVSAGQTGVDRTALDAAMAAGLEVGGWCPKGRRAEDGPIDARYPLTETKCKQYRTRTRWNVRDSNATLILCEGEPTGGTALTVEFCEQLNKPFLVVSPYSDFTLAIKFPGKGHMNTNQAEMAQLKAENKRLRMERNIYYKVPCRVTIPDDDSVFQHRWPQSS